MKNEQENAPAPATTFSAAQWGTSQIPIDPALQQQSQHATTHYAPYQHYQHYQQATYGHYQQYAPQQAAQQTQPPVTAVIPTRPAPQANAIDTADIATLNDALGSAGVDLRAEEETLQRSFDQYHTYRPYEDRSRKQPAAPNFDTRVIAATMREIGTQHKVTKMQDDSVSYLALALRARLQELVTAMIAASAHRTDAQFDRPASLYGDGNAMWSLLVRSDVAKQLAALERVEREEEMKVRRERKERADAAAAQAAAAAAQGANGMAVDSGSGFEDENGGPKKKKKKDGPGVTARNMSEDVRKKMSNAVASQAAGLGTGKYAWMTAANAATPVAKPKPVAAGVPAAGATGASTPAATATPAATGGSGAGSSSWARPYVPTKSAQAVTPTKEEDKRRAVTLRDAMFVIEHERGHGGGRGTARGWT